MGRSSKATDTAQIDALKRYRTGGQQKVTVEHVHVHAGGQAIVGTVEQGGGVAPKNEEQPHAKQISHAPQSPLWGEDEKREAVPIAAMLNGRCRMHGGRSPGAPRGDRNGNYKHGCFTLDGIADRCEISEWAKLMRQFAE